MVTATTVTAIELHRNYYTAYELSNNTSILRSTSVEKTEKGSVFSADPQKAPPKHYPEREKERKVRDLIDSLPKTNFRNFSIPSP